MKNMPGKLIATFLLTALMAGRLAAANDSAAALAAESEACALLEKEGPAAFP